MVSVLDSGAECPEFKSQLRRSRVTVLGKVFTPIVPLFTKPASSKISSSPLKGCEGLRAWRKVMAAEFMTHVTCRLTAKNRDQLRNPTLGNRVRATFTFFVWLNQEFDQGICSECVDLLSRQVAIPKSASQNIKFKKNEKPNYFS